MFIVCSSFDAKNKKRRIFKSFYFDIQLDDDESGRLDFIVTLLDKIFSIECFISEDDDVLGLVSVDKIELSSSSSSSD